MDIERARARARVRRWAWFGRLITAGAHSGLLGTAELLLFLWDSRGGRVLGLETLLRSSKAAVAATMKLQLAVLEKLSSANTSTSSWRQSFPTL